MKKKVVAVDLFCGGGGTSTGILMACKALGIDPAKVDLTAVNHWPLAIETHSANHPGARHLCKRLEQIQPERIIPGGRADLLWASPECIHHSIARGGKPCNDQSRSQAFVVLDWIQRLTPKAFLLENVPEFANWGPLYVSGKNAGKPISQERGSTFRAWCAALESLNYRLCWHILNCADYGDATTRQRLFLIARRGNAKVRFPDPTNSRDGKSGNLFTDVCQQWRPARDIIDWSIPGHSIFLGKDDCKSARLRLQRPLANNTIKRIEAGIRKFWGEWAEPFLVLLRGTSDRSIQGGAIQLDKPLPAITAGGNHIGLVTPFFTRFNGERQGQSPRTHGTDNPMPVIDTSGRYGLCQPFVVPQHAGGANRGVNEPLPTVTTTATGVGVIEPFLTMMNNWPSQREGRSLDLPIPTQTTANHAGVVRPFLIKYYGSGVNICSIETPLDTVTTDDRFGLVRPMVVEDPTGERYLMDILFRMLTPAELAAAHSFPSDYIWKGTKTQIVKQIGNSVPVSTAAALCKEVLAA